MTVRYPSRLIGKIHFLLLAIILFICVCMLLNQLGYDLNPDFYYDYLSAFDQVIVTYDTEMLIIAEVSFLVWLLRVHTALRRIEPQYPINEIEYLLRVMLPLVQFWGIASTFNQMSKFFVRHPSIAKKAIRIKTMVVFVYIFFFGMVLFTIVTYEGWNGMLVTYISLLGYIVMYTIFILTTYWVNQYLHMCVQDPPAPLPVQVPTTAPISMLATEWTADTVHSPFVHTYIGARVQAHIGARLAAKLIEFTIFVILTIAAIIPGAMNDNTGQMISIVSITWLGWFIYICIHLTMKGQTIGKWLLKLKIVRADTGAEGGFIHNVLLRMVANYFISMLVPFYSLADIMFIFSRDARCIHDRLASTQVIKLGDNDKA